MAESTAQGGQWQAAVEGYDAALDLLPLVVWRGVRQVDHEASLAAQALLASAAGTASLEAGDVAGAVRRLEQGRGVLWAQLSQERSDLGELRRRVPALAASLERVSALIGVERSAAAGRR